MSNKSVGYRRPPVGARFQKGKSGNPKGRPKASLNLINILQEAFREKVVIREKGKRKGMTKFQVIAKQLVNKAAVADDPKATQMLLNLFRIFGPQIIQMEEISEFPPPALHVHFVEKRDGEVVRVEGKERVVKL